jgi:radical SAM/Cys-rich protein
MGGEAVTGDPPGHIRSDHFKIMGEISLMEKTKPISSFKTFLNGKKLTIKNVETVQINMGKYCNQCCSHCHVGAGPDKKNEIMDKDTCATIIALIKKSRSVKTVDITGGAPELNANFKTLIKHLDHLHLIDRCNLTVLLEKGQEDTARFLAEHKVEIVASLPCYLEENVNRQRGNGVFDKSIKALQILNSLGYGKPGTGLTLNLVYNPLTPALPPHQKQLENAYKSHLSDKYAVCFNNLYTITNMPVKRFKEHLIKENELENYMKLLIDHFNLLAMDNLMCRNQISISWDGYLYNCDFNQMENLKIHSENTSIWDIRDLEEIDKQIMISDHCFGCTAGAGSSCSGAIV